MKTIVFSVSLSVLLAVSASCFMPIMLVEKDAGRTIQAGVGSRIDIALQANPTTGYNWYLESNISPQLKMMGEPVLKKGSSKLVGGGGKLVFKFKALKKGQRTITLAYKRIWEKGMPPIKQYNFKIVVN